MKKIIEFILFASAAFVVWLLDRFAPGWDGSDG
jgi:hypothetical protein